MDHTREMEMHSPSKDSSLSAGDVAVEKKSPNVSQAYDSRGGGILTEQTRVRRIFSFAQIFFFALTYMSSWEVMASNLSAVFWNGGPQTLAWGILVVVSGALAQSASLAEMSSIQPIAGAQYHWTYLLAPRSQKRFITWVQGWMTWFAWISTLAGVANVTAYILQGIVTANYPNYIPERWHLTLVIFAMLIIEGLMNMYTFYLIPWIELVAGILHVILFIIFVVVLVTMAPRHSAEFVFFESSSSSGWHNSFVSWNLGLLTPTWGFVGFDGAVHMSEEVRRAKHAVPRAMFWTIAINGVLAYAIIVVILFTMGSLDEVLNSSYPIMTVLVNATGSLPASTAMCCGLLIISLAVNLASIASVSRLTWAWARDGALPKYFAMISPRYRVPVRAMWLPVFITMLLALLNIASTAAFGAFIALSSMALFTSYMIAISCMLHARLTTDLQLGGWNLGRWGVLVNIYALIYSAYIFVFLPFPSSLPVEGINMNYALPIFTFFLICSLGSWWAWGKKNWPGLNKEVLEIVMLESDRDTKD